MAVVARHALVPSWPMHQSPVKIVVLRVVLAAPGANHAQTVDMDRIEAASRYSNCNGPANDAPADAATADPNCLAALKRLRVLDIASLGYPLHLFFLEAVKTLPHLEQQSSCH